MGRAWIDFDSSNPSLGLTTPIAELFLDRARLSAKEPSSPNTSEQFFESSVRTSRVKTSILFDLTHGLWINSETNLNLKSSTLFSFPEDVMGRSFSWLAVLALVAMAGCQTVPYQPYARSVKKKPGEGGVIAVTVAHQSEDMPKANELMTSNCGAGNYKVTEEGEVQVGTTTEGDSTQTHDTGAPGQQVGTLWGIPVTSGGREASNNTRSRTTTSAVKEWQITYECTKGVATTAPASPVREKAGKAKKM